MAIMAATLSAAVAISKAGTFVDLDRQWRDDDVWKDYVMRPKPTQEGTKEDPSDDSGHEDDRVERYDTPQYQTDADAAAAEPNCSTCVILEESA